MTAMTLPKGTTDKVLARMFPEPDPYADNPQRWGEENLGAFYWSKQIEVQQSVVRNRYTAVRASHDVSKSHTAAHLAAWWIESHPPGDAFVVSTAPTATQVEVILWREIGRAHRAGDLSGRITGGAIPMWKLGAEIVGYGRKPQDLTSSEEAAAAFSGIHAPYVLVILDEAGGIPKWLWDAVDTLATNESARVLAIGNPDDPASQFEKVCRPGSGWSVVHISAFDSPAFTGEEVPQYLLDVLVSRTWVEERKKRWGEDSPIYQSKVLGNFPEVSDDTLINPSLILQAQNRDTLSGLELGRYGADVARLGKNETVVYRNRGGVVRRVYRAHKQKTDVTTGAFRNLIDETRREVPMWIDADGVGAGPYDNLSGEEYPVHPFHGGEAAHNPRRFFNRRSEVFWLAREAFEQGEVDIDPEDEDLAAQLGDIKWKLTGKGQIKLETKDEMMKRGVASPDRADAFVMSLIPEPSWRVADTEPAEESLTSDLMERSF